MSLNSISTGFCTTVETSKRMRRIARAGTSPELRVRDAMKATGVKFRTNVTTLPGSPDMANLSRRIAVFVHGCFWHRHHGCSRATMPKKNSHLWKAKFSANVVRDRRKIRLLRRAGFTVVVVWECETRDSEKVRVRLGRALRRTK